ncbi:MULTISPECIES: copper amine oxidase N-terminal domain-containing protein [Paenibacillus]|uniref:copper amine oxidase N-terminal domain-containing protein n=1 Tax=Paenibacillus TaxID=44249 RepID=UPI0011A365A8|nr:MULTISPECIES: copper amine oxidase N-terminal domain-containing protein [Paenibacillus]MBJ9989269.1 copper amine oxidase N-terminal domain-containing protein [Paenibacillus sp. S28]
MKKRALTGTLALILVLSSASIVSAHPGRTDANGGHTCWTNCSKWGLEYGEYHYHNGGSSSSGSSSSSNTSKNSSSSKSSTRKSAVPTYKASGLKVYINGQKISFNSEPVIYQNTNLVPLREIAEGLGATITYDKDTGTIGVSKKNHKITLTIGSKTVFYNGTSETASAAPKVIKGVTYVPAQVFARGLGAGIEYSSSSNSLKISI